MKFYYKHANDGKRFEAWRDELVADGWTATEPTGEPDFADTTMELTKGTTILFCKHQPEGLLNEAACDECDTGFYVGTIEDGEVRLTVSEDGEHL